MRSEFSHLTLTSIPCAPTRPRPRTTTGKPDKESGHGARAHTHTPPWFTHDDFFFLDYDDANIALGVIQHGVLFLTRGCANRHAACTDGIATAEYSAKGLHTAVAHMLLSLGKGAEKH